MLFNINFDWNFAFGRIPYFQKAMGLTLALAFWGILFSIIIGILCAVILFYRIKGLRRIVNIYIELSRNTPLLIQLFFLYYGLTKIGITLSETTCAIIGLSFLGGSYMAEAFRGGIEAVSKAQIESGLSVGLSNYQIFRYIILPQALSVSLPSLGANCIFLIKETSIFGAIAVVDLMYIAKDIIGMYYKTGEALTLLVISYFIILFPLSLLLTYLERRVRNGQYGRTI